MWCHCENLVKALEAEDVRVFKFKTHNFGIGHALTRGLLALGKLENKALLTANYLCFLKDCTFRERNQVFTPVLIELWPGGPPEVKLVRNYKWQRPSEYQRDLRDIIACREHLDFYRLAMWRKQRHGGINTPGKLEQAKHGNFHPITIIPIACGESEARCLVNGLLCCGLAGRGACRKLPQDNRGRADQRCLP